MESGSKLAHFLYNDIISKMAGLENYLFTPSGETEKVTFGILQVNLFTSRVYASLMEDIQIRPGDLCALINLQSEWNLKQIKPKRMFSSATDSLQELADFFKERGRRYHMFGLTNEHIAHIARRYGFRTQKTDIDDCLKFSLNLGFSHSALFKRGSIVVQPEICYQSSKDFVSRFATRN